MSANLANFPYKPTIYYATNENCNIGEIMRGRKNNPEYRDQKKKNEMPLYTIGVVSELLGITAQTLRLYEKHGLIKPFRKNKNRFYSENDTKWLTCLRELIHDKKISIEGIKKLLNYATCWEITDCPEERKRTCFAYKDTRKPCWELNKMICACASLSGCKDCIVFLQNQKKHASTPDNRTGNSSIR